MVNYDKDQIKNRYFVWLYNYVCKGRANENVSYKKLFMLLFDTEFTFYIRNDFNRARDGIDLRYRFANTTKDISYDNILDILDEPCNVLEMLVALAIRIEESIMDDPQYGDRTSQWFWIMLSNLGLSSMTDDNFNKKVANEIIYRFLERRYAPDGRGGLFYIRDCTEDLTQVEIATQVYWFLDKFV